MSFFACCRLLASLRCVGLLALALCFPVAQWASATHAMLHLQSAAERQDPSQWPDRCDICVADAAIGSAAPLPAATSFTATALPQARPAAPTPTSHFAAVTPAYRSRAPPLAHA